MAVTGAIFKALTFNGESSRTYGVYITGQAVYNAPTRDVEMVTIPGRSGAFPLDHGRFENIEVTYPAGTFADNEEDFAAAISDFRNALCAAKGYCRLEDEYNPNEYRLAIYKSGLEVEPTALKAGEFDITFECKPQRYLKTGEDPVTIGASTALTNPTRFEASPEIRVKGYGTVAFNGYQVEIPDAVYGEVSLVEGARKSYGIPVTLGSDEYATTGDTITVEGERIDGGVQKRVDIHGPGQRHAILYHTGHPRRADGSGRRDLLVPKGNDEHIQHQHGLRRGDEPRPRLGRHDIQGRADIYGKL